MAANQCISNGQSHNANAVFRIIILTVLHNVTSSSNRGFKLALNLESRFLKSFTNFFILIC